MKNVDADEPSESRLKIAGKSLGLFLILTLVFAFAFAMATSALFNILDVDNETSNSIAPYAALLIAVVSSLIVTRDQIRTKTNHLSRVFLVPVIIFGCLIVLVIVLCLMLT